MNTQTDTTPQDLTFVVQERAIIYCRVSTDEQAESGTSIDMQAEKNTAYAQANNMQVVGVFKEDFTGRVLDRPELNKVREALRRGQADNLIVYKPNRLDRSEWGLNTLLLMQELKGLGVNLHFAQSNHRIDLHNPMDVFMNGHFTGWQAGEDFSETVRKLYEGRLARARSGYVIPQGKSPYGYRAVKKDKKWHFEIIEDEARVVRLIFEWYVVDGLSLSGIANKLDNLNIKTQRGVSWRIGVIHKIIGNSVYYGVWYFSKDQNGRPTAESIPVPVPPIISRELWDIAQARLQENKTMATRNRKPGRYLLSNRLTCQACGYKMYGRLFSAKIAGKTYQYLYYVCPNSHFTDKKKYSMCDTQMFRADKVDAAVWDWLEKIANDRDKLQAGLQDYNNGQQSKLEPIRRELALVESILAEKENELTGAMSDLKVLSSPRAKATKGAEIAQLEAVIDALETDKKRLTAQLDVNSFAPEQAINITTFMAQVAQKIARLREMETQGVDLPELKMAVYEGKRQMLAWLDVQTELFVEGGKKKVKIFAKVCPDGEVLPIVSPDTSTRIHNRQNWLTITEIIDLE